MVRRGLLCLLVALACLVLPACMELGLQFDVDRRGSGKVIAEVRSDPGFMNAQVEKDVAQQFRKDGWSFARQETRGAKRVLVFEKPFTQCADVSDSSMALHCRASYRNLLERTFTFEVNVRPTIGAGATVSATLPGQLLTTNGEVDAAGHVSWNGGQRRLTAVSAYYGFPQLSDALARDLAILLGLAACAAVALVEGTMAFLLVLRRRPRSTPVHCTRCGQISTAGARFCRKCGVALPTPTDALPARPGRDPRPAIGLALVALLAAWGLIALATRPISAETCVHRFMAAVGEGKFDDARASYLGGSALSLGEADLAEHVVGVGPGQQLDVQLTGEGASRSGTARLLLPTGSRLELPLTLTADKSDHWRITDLGRIEGVGLAHAQEGQRLCQTSAMRRAEEAFRQALAANPDDATYVAWLGACYARVGELERAEDQLRKATTMRPAAMPKAWLDLVAVQGRRGDIKAAEQTARQGIASDPGNADLINALARLLLEHGGSPDEALALADKAHSLQPGSASILDTLGWAQHRKGNRAEAIRLLRQAVERAPNDTAIRDHYERAGLTADVWHSRAQTHVADGRYVDALHAYDSAIELEPNSQLLRDARARTVRLAVDAHLQRARVLLGQTHYDPALAECDAALQLDATETAATDLKQRIEQTKRVLGYK